LEYISKIENLTSVSICDYKSFCQAYTALMDRFGAVGCKSARHKISSGYSFVKPDPHHADLILKKALTGKGAEITREELSLWQTQLLRFFSVECVKRGWITELEYTSYSHLEISTALSYLSSQNALPTVLIYSDDTRVSEICRMLCHTEHNVSTKVLQGIGFADNLKDIATKTAIGSVVGLLSKSYGYNIGIMHELWRMEACNLLGCWVDKGIYPKDAAAEVVRKISYQNAATYFEIN
jgi:glucuronate isomerase